jgi:ankyrin repeat protein
MMESKTLRRGATAGEMAAMTRDRDLQDNVHHWASKGNMKETTRLLAKKENVNKRDGAGQTPLHLAASFGHVEIVALLLKCKALVNAQDSNNWTPLICAAYSGQLTVMLVSRHSLICLVLLVFNLAPSDEYC